MPSSQAISRSWRWLALAVVVVVAAGAGYFVWQAQLAANLPEGFVSTNGRIEGTEVDVATKTAGRIETILVREGASVTNGQLVALMDTKVLNAQLREALAERVRAGEARKTSLAQEAQRQSECALAIKEFNRTKALFEKGHASEEKLDRDRTAKAVAESACVAARARVVEAAAAINAAAARVERLRAELVESRLTAPRSGRVLYRLAEPGEVLPAGGKVLTIVDLDDIYMTVFLPTAQAGQVRIGAEARIVLDALPDRPVPARISFVAAQAQFTPKQVETAAERQKLMFRIKVQALSNLDDLLKPGMPGLAYVRLDSAAPWPATLK